MAYTRVMKRTLVGGVGTLLLLGLVAGPLLGLGTSASRVYTVDEVQAGLHRQPRLWIGRTILIRGWSNSWGGTGCPVPPRNTPISSPLSCGAAWLMLTPTFPYTGSAPLLRHGPDLTRLDLPLSVGMGLHTLPVVGPTLFRWSGSRMVRVTLTTSNGVLCGGPPPCPGGVQAP